MSFWESSSSPAGPWAEVRAKQFFVIRKKETRAIRKRGRLLALGSHARFCFSFNPTDPDQWFSSTGCLGAFLERI